MSFTFLKAEGYDVGKSIVSLEHLGFAKDMLDRYDDKIVLPVDFMTADGEKKINEFNDNDIGYDIGSNSIKIFNKTLETIKGLYLMDRWVCLKIISMLKEQECF